MEKHLFLCCVYLCVHLLRCFVCRRRPRRPRRLPVDANSFLPQAHVKFTNCVLWFYLLAHCAHDRLFLLCFLSFLLLLLLFCFLLHFRNLCVSVCVSVSVSVCLCCVLSFARFHLAMQWTTTTTDKTSNSSKQASKRHLQC